VKFLLTDDASQYFRLLEVKTVRGIGQQMFANFRTLIKFVFVDSGVVIPNARKRASSVWNDYQTHMRVRN